MNAKQDPFAHARNLLAQGKTDECLLIYHYADLKTEPPATQALKSYMAQHLMLQLGYDSRERVDIRAHNRVAANPIIKSPGYEKKLLEGLPDVVLREIQTWCLFQTLKAERGLGNKIPVVFDAAVATLSEWSTGNREDEELQFHLDQMQPIDMAQEENAMAEVYRAVLDALAAGFLLKPCVVDQVHLTLRDCGYLLAICRIEHQRWYENLAPGSNHRQRHHSNRVARNLIQQAYGTTTNRRREQAERIDWVQDVRREQKEKLAQLVEHWPERIVAP